MALEIRDISTTLQLSYDLGVDGDGKKLVRRRSYSNVKREAADQDLYDVAATISSLQSYPVTQILVTEKDALVNV
ncbi:MAG: DUF1659 domain-containing protein [Caldicoprobacterales bacterium]